MQYQPVGSLGSLRERNRLAVIDTLKQRGKASRAEISRLTGLSRTTVSSLVTDLQSLGLIRRAPRGARSAQRAAGRTPPVLVALDRSAGAVVGLDFGHDSLRVAVADLSYSILAESFAERLEVDTAAEDALDTAATLVSRADRRRPGVDRGRVLAAGMGLPGPIDRESGRVHSQPILPGWVGLAPRRGDGGAPRAARPPGQRRERRRAGRVDLRRRPRDPRDWPTCASRRASARAS